METITETELCEVCKEEKQEGYELDDLNVCLSCYTSAIDRDYDRIKDEQSEQQFNEVRDLK